MLSDATLAISVQPAVPSGERSTRNALSLALLSAQTRSIWFREEATGVRPEGGRVLGVRPDPGEEKLLKNQFPET